MCTNLDDCSHCTYEYIRVYILFFFFFLIPEYIGPHDLGPALDVVSLDRTKYHITKCLYKHNIMPMPIDLPTVLHSYSVWFVGPQYRERIRNIMFSRKKRPSVHGLYFLDVYNVYLSNILIIIVYFQFMPEMFA